MIFTSNSTITHFLIVRNGSLKKTAAGIINLRRGRTGLLPSLYFFLTRLKTDYNYSNLACDVMRPRPEDHSERKLQVITAEGQTLTQVNLLLA